VSVDEVRHAHERARLVEHSRRLVADGLCVGTAGNLSVRVGDGFLVTPSGLAAGQLRAADMVLVDGAGTVLEGDRRPTSELAMHLTVYDADPAAGAVVHTHSRAATALACVTDGLPAIHYTITDLGGPIRVAPYATFGTAELAASVRAALDGRSAALLQNHGAVTTGPDLDRAYGRALLLEWLCALYARAVALGPPRLLREDELAAAAARFTALRYGELAD
jgi:L-fuculose-phosphate aldolase